MIPALAVRIGEHQLPVVQWHVALAEATAQRAAIVEAIRALRVLHGRRHGADERAAIGEVHLQLGALGDRIVLPRCRVRVTVPRFVRADACAARSEDVVLIIELCFPVRIHIFLPCRHIVFVLMFARNSPSYRSPLGNRNRVALMRKCGGSNPLSVLATPFGGIFSFRGFGFSVVFMILYISISGPASLDVKFFERLKSAIGHRTAYGIIGIRIAPIKRGALCTRQTVTPFSNETFPFMLRQSG